MFVRNIQFVPSWRPINISPVLTHQAWVLLSTLTGSHSATGTWVPQVPKFQKTRVFNIYIHTYFILRWIPSEALILTRFEINWCTFFVPQVRSVQKNECRKTLDLKYIFFILWSLGMIHTFCRVLPQVKTFYSYLKRCRSPRGKHEQNYRYLCTICEQNTYFVHKSCTNAYFVHKLCTNTGNFVHACHEGSLQICQFIYNSPIKNDVKLFTASKASTNAVFPRFSWLKLVISDIKFNKLFTMTA